MNYPKRKHALPGWLGAGASLFCILSIFFRPAAAAQGVLNGLSLCYKNVIPALFPFLVLSRLLLESRAASILGLLLQPYTRLLSIRSRKASAALLCGFLGGFACGAKAVDTLYRENEVTQEEAALLLVCCIGSGPGFIVGSVGGLMLGSTGAGGLLLAAQLGASLLCGLLAALWADLRGIRRMAVPCSASTRGTAPVQDERSGEKGFVPAVRDAVHATLLLCGYVTLFSFFVALAVPDGADAFARYAASLPLEVTSACRAACETASPMRTQLCCAALSAMGASVFFQVRALLAPQVAIIPLFVSRVVHVPLALLFLWIFTAFFPHAASVGLSLDQGILPAVRMPCDAMLALFLLAAISCGALPSLQARKNGV